MSRRGPFAAGWARAAARAAVRVLGAPLTLVLAAACTAGPAVSAGPAGQGPGPQRPALPVVSAVVPVSGGCAGKSAESWQAVDPGGELVCEIWIGCGGIGFARSADGGRSFGQAFMLPESAKGWDPAVTVGTDGTVYAAFMVFRAGLAYPVVDISADHGASFPVSRSLLPPAPGNFGDRVFIATAPAGHVYLTWDYGPVNNIQAVCDPHGSCSFTNGGVNAVFQGSSDGGRTWSEIIHISPGFPHGGADSAPLLVEPGGRIDVIYQGYQVLDLATDKLGVALPYFTASADGGQTWSAPVRIGPAKPVMTRADWWIDGSLAMDGGGGLFATWDTQSGGHDIAWISRSATGGRTWSAPVPVTSGPAGTVNLVQVAGGAPGLCYVAWLTDGAGPGYAVYLRAYSASAGWLGPAVKVSGPGLSRADIWPGDTIGLTPLPGGGPGARRVMVSWGGTGPAGGQLSRIWSAVVSQLP